MSTKVDNAVATVGCFDGFHMGHRALVGELLSQARGRGGSSIAFTFDRHPLALIAPEKEPARLSTVEQRRRMLLEAGVDRVVVLPFTHELRSLTAAEFMAMLSREYGTGMVVRGFNHHFGSDRLSEPEQYAEAGLMAGVDIATAPEYRTPSGLAVSSTAIRKALTERRITDATEMLGRPYRLCGTVVGGHQLGRGIGFPTANIDSSAMGLLVPGRGVYAAKATIDGNGRAYPAMVNIGLRPTVNEDGTEQATVEAHLIGFDGDIYGHTLALDFIKDLRDERKFSSLDDLKKQLEADKKEINGLLS